MAQGWLHALWRRIDRLTKREQLDREIDDELAFHLAKREEQNRAAGIAGDEALYAARRQFGNTTSVKERTAEMWTFAAVDHLKQDIRYAARTLWKNPAFAMIAVLTLALGIGASTAVFSLVHAILLKPLPYPHPEQIVIPGLVSPPGVNLGSDYFPWGQTQFRLVTNEHPAAFQAFGAFQNDSFNLTGSGDPLYLDGFRTSADFFNALGIVPALGRTFTAEEDSPGHEHEVILSDQLWREQFNADRNMVGRSLQLNGYAYTVIGVMPAGFVFPRAEEMPSSFNFPREAQLWVPLAIPAAPKGGPSELATIARLTPGVTMEQAQAGLDVITKHAEALDPRWKGWFNTRLTPLSSQVTGDARRPLQLMFGAVGVVLLIACSNVANLILTRSLARRKEFTLRAALGAGRARLIRQLLTESVLLAVAAGVLGIFLADAGVQFVKAFGPSNIPRLREVALDVPVFAFALGVSVVTGILFGLVPALSSTGEDLTDALKEGGQRSGASPTSQRLRNMLLIAQVALALVLVISASLLTRTFFRLLAADGGFNADRVLTFQLSLPYVKYAEQPHIVGFYRDVLDRLRSIPGVQSAGIGETVPMGGEGESTGIRLPDHPASSSKEIPFANYTIISPGYLSAVGTSLLRGRDFCEADKMDSTPVAIINISMVKKFWPNEEPLGKQVGPGSSTYPLMTIVGVVADAKHVSLREKTEPEVYVPYNQKVWPSMLNMRVAVRTRNDPAAMNESLREAVHSLDPDLPLAKVTTLMTLVDNSVAQPRFAMLVLASFGILALLLACIGMYGVISYLVEQRTREIGVRIALGAQRSDLFAMVIGQGARLAALGILIGLAAAFGVARLMSSFLYGVRAADPLTFVGVPLVLAGVAFLACYLPARRAMGLDPITALRYE